MLTTKLSNSQKFPKAAKIAVFVILSMGLVLFIVSRTSALRHGPAILLTSPTPGETIYKPLVTVKGVAKRTTELSLNGESIFIDQDGIFSEPMTLNPGYNIVTLEAKDRFGKTTRTDQKLIRAKMEPDKEDK